MKHLKWDLSKNEQLKQERGVSFEELLQSKLIAVKRHPKRQYQNIFLFEHKGYVWIVPYVEQDDTLFLKTLYPSRKYTSLYKKGELQ